MHPANNEPRFLGIDLALATRLENAAQYILRVQRADGAIPWFKDGKLDPWDHTEAAMGLSIAGQHKAAEQAYYWLANEQLPDGSWNKSYFEEAADDTAPKLKETNFIAYVATGVWQHYCITNNETFLRDMFPVVQRAIDFVLQFQNSEGEIAWAVNSYNQPEDDALITACASILRSIECAYLSAQKLQVETHAWSEAWWKLRDALANKPYRFDRTWESKARFAMDWYYPILAGIYWPKAAKLRLDAKWDEFIEEKLGCRCVNDAPWVTIAESSELIMALVAAGNPEKAEELFKQLDRWQDEDGGYWTGYVFNDKKIWPEEKTTWTAGAILLAADAIYQLTPASTLFTKRSDLHQTQYNITRQPIATDVHQ